MPTYIGFSTIGANQPKTTNRQAGNDGGYGGILRPLNTGKKFRLVDDNLVIRDLINALNIRVGEKVGQPSYGTTLWSFIFEPNTIDVQRKLKDEITRVAKLDPRIILNTVTAFSQEHGILVELEIAVNPFNQAQLLSIFFNSSTGTAALQ